MADFASLTSVGLAFAAVGVVGLGAAFFLKSPKVLQAEADAGTYERNNAALESLVKSQFDGVFGTIMLVIGFALLWCGVNGFQSPGGVQISYSILIMFTLFYVGFARASFVKDRVNKARATRGKI
jgi:hypothetical protein